MVKYFTLFQKLKGFVASTNKKGILKDIILAMKRVNLHQVILA